MRDGSAFHATTTDVSPGGLKLRAERTAGERLASARGAFYAELTLALITGDETVIAACVVVHVQPLPDGAFVSAGVRFVYYHGKSYFHLGRSLEKALAPGENFDPSEER